MMRALFFPLIMIALVALCYGQIYKYIDEHGRTVYVDNEMKIPEQYRQEKTTIFEQSSRPVNKKEHTEMNPSPLDREYARIQKQKKSRSTEVEIKDNMIFVPVEIAKARKKAKLKLLLDTGAQVTILHEESLKELDITDYKTSFGQQASGSFFASKVITLTKLKVGPIKEEGMSVHVIAYRSSRAEHDGLLGMDFLSKHKYVIDYDKKLLHWE